MSLAERVAHAFPAAARTAGEALFRADRVSPREAGATRFAAWVRNEQRHCSAAIEVRGGALGVRCDCPTFDDQNVYCEHLWAMVLAADGRGLMLDLASRTRVPLVELDDETIGTTSARARKEKDEAPAPAAPLAPVAWRDLADRPPHDPRIYAPFRREHRRESRCVLYVGATSAAGELVFAFEQRTITPRGNPREWRTVSLREAASTAAPEDARTFEMLAACRTISRTYGEAATVAVPFVLTPALCALVGRGAMRSEVESKHGQRVPFVFDAGGPWRFVLVAKESVIAEAEAGPEADLVVRGALVRGEERIELTQAWMVAVADVMILPDRIATLHPITDFEWVRALFARGAVRVPAAERAAFLGFAAERGGVELPASLRFEEIARPPLLVARFGKPDVAQARVGVRVSAIYGDREVTLGAHGRALADTPNRRVHARDLLAERRAIEVLANAGVRFALAGEGLDLPLGKLALTTRALLRDGWRVEGADARFRGATSTRAAVTSGIDWFDLRVEIGFDGEMVPLPRLLAAARRGDTFVPLGDGSLGLLPDDWLDRWGAFADLGRTRDDDVVRFARSQAPLVDAIVGASSDVTTDESFTAMRAALVAGFRAAAEPTVPPTFTGALRDYQRSGVAWMEMLAAAGFGGCLADDMGLGKTVQVLARIAARHAEGQGHGPSLVVAPRSLIFNWKDEAARFVPSLRVLDHSGTKRAASAERFAKADLVLTTYGTLRTDAEALAAIDFDYVIFDEAQAIKNDASVAAKAARQLRARHRLALTGTPIENHLGELWSLFDVLNPGMLGRSAAFKRWTTTRAPEGDDLALLARALRPFLLRRTKAEVAKELPERVEQTIACELDPEQRALYDELRKHYRRTLLARERREEGQPNAMNVLEALLRLRQAACHPALLDPAHRGASSAKMDVLFAQLASVLEEGQKAIIFSQFTSLLALVRARLIADRVGYEDLDGTTRNRAARVERFQEDENCRVFLVSLKAGGTGLNLTAASYVFLLDPWWNPAAEAQAIDRAHRIGQTRTVFAYRLVAKDTIEERVMALQATKRALAEGILGPEAWGVVRELKVEDLELLLS